MNQINIQYHKTKYGHFILGSFKNQLCLLDFEYRKKRTTIDKRLQNGLNATYLVKNDKILIETKKQLDEYFDMRRKKFDIPIVMVGTFFQKSVWNALLKIPYGTTASYLQLAQNINNKKAVRAVANANGANSMAIIIPCHRIIGSDGELTGYAGGLTLKKKLLDLEQNLFI
jgi:methylated-DNA-[protein]-cysteine S-methyltransferase